MTPGEMGPTVKEQAASFSKRWLTPPHPSRRPGWQYLHVIGYKRNLSPEAPKALAEGARHAVNAPKALAEGVHHKMVAVPHKKSHNGSGSAEGKPKNSKGRLRRTLSAQAFSLGFQPGPPGRHLLAVQLLPPGWAG